MIRALLWDVDGTLAETERDGHRVAFNRAFAAAGVPWRWSEARYGELLSVAGGRERLLHDMASQPAAPAAGAARAQLAARIHHLKNQHYADIVRSGALPLRAGVAELIDECLAANVPLGIVTTTSRANLEALLACHLGHTWASKFAVTVCAEQAPRKKPDPQAYFVALAALGLRAADVVALEDSAPGIEAARRAGVPVILTRSFYFSAVAGEGTLAAGPSLGGTQGWQPPPTVPARRVTLGQIERWYADARYSRAAAPPVS